MDSQSIEYQLEHVESKPNHAFVHMDYVLSCQLSTEREDNYYQYLQNCSLYTIDTKKVNNFLIPTYRLVLNLSQNNTLRITRFVPEYGKSVSYARLTSVVEQNDQLTLKCYFKQNCFVKYVNRSHEFRFEPLTQLQLPTTTTTTEDSIQEKMSESAWDYRFNPKYINQTSQHMKASYYTFTAFMILFFVCIFIVAILVFNVCIWTFCTEENVNVKI